MLSTRKTKWWLSNPTNGSWWIVQFSSDRGSEVSTHCRGWDYYAAHDMSVDKI